jgi:hypothetical protein
VYTTTSSFLLVEMGPFELFVLGLILNHDPLNLCLVSSFLALDVSFVLYHALLIRSTKQWSTWSWTGTSKRVSQNELFSLFKLITPNILS